MLTVASRRLVVLCSVVEQKVLRLKVLALALVKGAALEDLILIPTKDQFKHWDVEKVMVVASSIREIPAVEMPVVSGSMKFQVDSPVLVLCDEVTLVQMVRMPLVLLHKLQTMMSLLHCFLLLGWRSLVVLGFQSTTIVLGLESSKNPMTHLPADSLATSE